ncbi:MAG: SseB family protein [Candidatus Ornithomonoglobus sp.]
MAFWNKKKKDEENPEVQSAAESAEEAKDEESTLDIVKATMEQAKEELREERNQAAEEARAAQAANEQPGGAMPTADEIKHAQEILARAQAARADQIPAGAKVGINAPVNTANLKAVIAQFMQSKTQENLKLVMDCLQNPKTLVCVPAQIITSKENQEKMKQGGEVKLEGPIQISPVLLTDNTGKKVFPIFSGEDTIPDNIKNSTPKVNLPFQQCFNIMKGLKDVTTFALDPFTANITMGVNIQQNPNAPKKA